MQRIGHSKLYLVIYNFEIFLWQYSFNHFSYLCRWIYTSKIELKTIEEACNVVYAAKKYWLPALIDECRQFIKTELTPVTAVTLYEFADSIDEPSLKTLGLQVINFF